MTTGHAPQDEVTDSWHESSQNLDAGENFLICSAELFNADETRYSEGSPGRICGEAK
jgi:hypothetical protein